MTLTLKQRARIAARVAQLDARALRTQAAAILRHEAQRQHENYNSIAGPLAILIVGGALVILLALLGAFYGPSGTQNGHPDAAGEVITEGGEQ